MRLESYHEVKDFCRQNHLLEPSDRVLVAFSGGADSVYLARALLELSQEWDFVVELIHVNHQIRGEEAERDEMFCKSFAEENGIRIHICRGDVPKMVQEQKYSLEEAARIYRYRCIEETAVWLPKGGNRSPSGRSGRNGPVSDAAGQWCEGNGGNVPKEWQIYPSTALFMSRSNCP